ncbi:dTDP-4-amino-4,6-dideoxygalactose transaminase [Ruaniaceae bacterium KH17]|nr:dTDP-4-amino-4,6-dideoxygalactose transaminase [Ruaniaceae bacterium KH17]
MAIPFSPPDLRDEDIEAVSDVLRSGWITSGPVGQRFEETLASFVGVNRAVGLNSCTAALELSLRVLGIGPGDEVIVPAYTYSASAAVVDHVGARIVLVDVAPGSYVPSADQILAAITEKTKAVIVVDLAGVPFDTPTLRAALDERAIQSDNPLLAALGRPAIVVDAAHSLGGARDGFRAGQMGDFTAFSFHAVKNLTTAEGGALVWRSDLPVDSTELATIVRRLSLHGQSKDAFSKMKAGAWEYDIVELGFKCNMPDTLAALGLSQLSRYESQIARRHEIVALYDSLLSSRFSSLAHSGTSFRSSAHLHMLDLGSHYRARDEIIARMADAEIATNVHYKPLPLFTAYKKLGFQIADFPHANQRFEAELTLPLHTLLTDDDVALVASTLLRVSG